VREHPQKMNIHLLQLSLKTLKAISFLFLLFIKVENIRIEIEEYKSFTFQQAKTKMRYIVEKTEKS
jgi:hypothetical protein